MAYMGFNALKAKLAKKPGITNSGAVAAAIGRNKYGKKKFQKAAATGTKLGHVPLGRRARLEETLGRMRRKGS